MLLFSLLVGLGASLGLWRVAQKVPTWQQVRWVQAGLVVLTGALVGARLGFVFIHWNAFLARPMEVFAFSLGGLFWPAGFAGGLLTLLAVSAAWGKHPMRVADGLAPMLGPLAAMIWLGCWRAGTAYGMEVPASTWWAVRSPDEQGLWLPRVPLQLLAALTLTALFAGLEQAALYLQLRGQLASVSGVVFGLHTLLFTMFRADPAPTWHGLAYDMWGALAVTLLALAGCAVSFGPIAAQKMAAINNRRLGRGV